MLRSPIPSAALLALLALLPSTGACRSSAGPPQLVVASDLANEPFAWVDEGGRARGRDVAMMEVVAGLIDYDLVWRRMPFGELLDAAAGGEVDAVCATLGVTAARAERVRFTRPYFRTELLVVVRTGDTLRSLEDLAGRSVGAAAGTTSEDAVRARLTASNARFGHKDDGARLAALGEGALDAVAMDGPAARRVVARSGGVLRLLDEPLAREDYALALPPDSALAEHLDAAIAYLVASGAMDALNAEYGLATSARLPDEGGY